jgi:CDP-glucose 4,6-dehydratase
VSDAPAVHEAGRLAIDASMARAHLGWAPYLPLDEALSWTTDWYSRYHHGEPADALVGAQIKQYEALSEALP